MFTRLGSALAAPDLYRVNPAFLAAVAFVAIQVSIGIIFKIAQRDDGRYAFSQSSSIAISEFCKMLLSTCFFYRQCCTRLSAQELQDPEKDTYIPLGRISEDSSIGEKDSQHDVIIQRLSTSESSFDDRTQDGLQGPNTMGNHNFIICIKQEIGVHTAYGFAHLALFYAIINNSTFLLFRLADPGTISLVRSGITLITALNLRLTVGQRISKRQWLAIGFQICGVLVTQYRPDSGSLYPLSTYILIICQTAVSASAGVYNQVLLKSENGSLHVCNMALYAAGATINIFIHLASRVVNPNEPSFFEGYGSWPAVMVIVSNIFIGLAITAVYKYSDALVKCFATAVSTGILLYIGPLIFHVPLSFLVFPGTITVFAATWLYLDSPAQKKVVPHTEDASLGTEWRDADIGTQSNSILSVSRVRDSLTALSPHGKLRHAGLAMSSTVAVSIILALVGFKSAAPPSGSKVPSLESPLASTMAFSRSPNFSPASLSLFQQYEPFFASIHISMPDPVEQDLSASNQFNNLTADNYDDDKHIYTRVAQTMQLILDASSTDPASQMEGLMYFESDTWIDPMSFSTEDRAKIWFPDGDGPRFECMTDSKQYGHNPAWKKSREDQKSVSATKAIFRQIDSDLRSRVNPDEFCIGRSDMYYIPRHYFKDYIYLSMAFFSNNVTQALAVPTMVHIIDLMRRVHTANTHRVVTHLSDCWSSPKEPQSIDIQRHRCGFGLDLDNNDVTRTSYAMLNTKAELLGNALYDEKEAEPLVDAETIFNPKEVSKLLSKPLEFYQVEEVED